MFLGEDLPSWMVLALGAALAVGNLTALIRPRPLEPASTDAGGETGSDTAADADRPPEYLERPPLVRSLVMIAIGTVAALWALVSLMG